MIDIKRAAILAAMVTLSGCVSSDAVVRTMDSAQTLEDLQLKGHHSDAQAVSTAMSGTFVNGANSLDDYGFNYNNLIRGSEALPEELEFLTPASRGYKIPTYVRFQSVKPDYESIANRQIADRQSMAQNIIDSYKAVGLDAVLAGNLEDTNSFVWVIPVQGDHIARCDSDMKVSEILERDQIDPEYHPTYCFVMISPYSKLYYESDNLQQRSVLPEGTFLSYRAYLPNSFPMSYLQSDNQYDYLYTSMQKWWRQPYEDYFQSLSKEQVSEVFDPMAVTNTPYLVNLKERQPLFFGRQ